MFRSPNNKNKVINHINFYRDDKLWIHRISDKASFFITLCFGRQFPKVYRWLLEYHSYFVGIFLPGTTFLQSLQKVQYLLTETICDGLKFCIWVAYCTKNWILSKIVCYWQYTPHFMLILQVHCCPLNFLNSLNTHRFLYIS